MTSTQPGTVGIIANPAAGNDIRRLVSAASTTSDMAKIGIVRRSIIGAIEGGARRVLVADDYKSFGQRALSDIDDELMVPVEVVGNGVAASSANTTRMAALLHQLGCGALITLGGDGTHRDIVKGWRQAPLVPISTGTNNVFPKMLEATTAGQAAAVAASRPGSIGDIAHQAKLLEVTGPGVNDIALIDVALVDTMFTASRAVWDITLVRHLIATTAEPATIGLSAIAASVLPVGRDEPGGVYLRLDPTATMSVRAPIAPGLYVDAPIAAAELIAPDVPITISGPGVVAFDGERDLVLRADQQVQVTLRTNGPWVIDPGKALSMAPSRAALRRLQRK